MKIVHASISENNNTGWDGKSKAGDQTGYEVCIRDWYSKPWDFILRYPDSIKAKEATLIACKLANANIVGYDQSERNTLYSKMAKYNFNVDKYIASNEKSECDCSSFVYTCYACVIPDMRSYNNAPTTSYMKDFYTSFGFECFTSSKYRYTGNYLQTGDILVKSGSHTAIAVEDEIKKCNVVLPILQFGSKGETVKIVQRLLVYKGFDVGKSGCDGDYGTDTYNAVRRYQKAKGLIVDGIVGSETYTQLLT